MVAQNHLSLQFQGDTRPSPLCTTQPWNSEDPPREKTLSLLFIKDRESTSGHTEPEALEDSPASTAGVHWGSSSTAMMFRRKESCVKPMSQWSASLESAAAIACSGQDFSVRPCPTGSPSQWLYALRATYILISIADVLQIIYRFLASKEGYRLIPQHV